MARTCLRGQAQAGVVMFGELVRVSKTPRRRRLPLFLPFAPLLSSSSRRQKLAVVLAPPPNYSHLQLCSILALLPNLLAPPLLVELTRTCCSRRGGSPWPPRSPCRGQSLLEHRPSMARFSFVLTLEAHYLLRFTSTT
jgi:hypothetical protein